VNNIMPIKTDPQGLSNAIDKMSRGVEQGKYVRELVINAFDAFGRSGREGKKTITISRDREYGNKIVIANSTPAASITQEIAENSLNSVFRPANGHEENHGVGAKIAYLPQNPEGLLYRCRNTDGSQGPFAFILHKNVDNIYGLKTFYDDGDPRGYQMMDLDESEFCYEDSETEVVLLGKTDDDDTWLATLGDISTTGRESVAGWAIRDHLNKILWAPPEEDVELRIAIYDSEKEFVQFARPRYLNNIMKAQKPSKDGQIAGCHGSVSHPDGATIHFYALNFEKGKKKETHNPSGFIGYIHNDEVFVKKGMSRNAVKRQFSLAGVVTHHRSVSVIIDFAPNLKLNALLDRSDVTNEDGVRAETLMEPYLEYFRNNMPDNLKNWMENLFVDTDTDIEKEAEKFYKNKSSSTPIGAGNTAQGSTSTSGVPTGTGKGKKSSTKTPRRKGSRTGNNTTSSGNAPSFKMGEEGDDTPLVYFDRVNYSITINIENSIFLNKKSRLLNKTNSINKVVEDSLAKELYIRTVKYHAMLLDTYPTESDLQLNERMSEDRLDALATDIDTSTSARIQKSINRQNIRTAIAA
jgi:hypothetical protein